MSINTAEESLALERSVVTKFTWRLAPFLAILYVFCLIDRGNVGIAALQMQPALKFSNEVYGTGAGIFFLGYFLFEVPSNLIMERVGARRWIARIMLTWGLISASMMFVHTPASFYTLRFLLGIAEAGFFPGVVLYITYWIPATSRARAMARFLALTAILGLFGSPLGGLLLKLNGWMGLGGWQWLFLLEGIPSILLAFVVFYTLPDKPTEAKWLTDEEKIWLASRLEREGQHEHALHRLKLSTAFTDPRLRQLILVFIISSTAGNAIGFFAPKMIKASSSGLWSDSKVATLLILPEIAGAIAMLLASTHSDRTGKRNHHVLIGYLIAALGYALCVVAPRSRPRHSHRRADAQQARRADRRRLLLGADGKPSRRARRRGGHRAHQLGGQSRRLHRPEGHGLAGRQHAGRLHHRHLGRRHAHGHRSRDGLLPPRPAEVRGGVDFLKIITCCRGSFSISSSNLSCVKSAISFLTWVTLILWTSLIGTSGSSLRYSTKTSRPPGLRPLIMFCVIS
jgi:MFS transporter, ACS family, tartrate transporter